MINIDKLYHMLVGFAFGALGLLLGEPDWLIMAVVMAIAAGKELGDYMNRDHHTCDAMDFIVTVVGGITSILTLKGWM